MERTELIFTTEKENTLFSEKENNSTKKRHDITTRALWRAERDRYKLTHTPRKQHTSTTLSSRGRKTCGKFHVLASVPAWRHGRGAGGREMVQSEEAAAASITAAGGGVPALCQPPTAQDHLAISTAAQFTQHHHFRISLAMRQPARLTATRKARIQGTRTSKGGPRHHRRPPRR